MTAVRSVLACLLVAAAWLLAQAPVNDQVKVEFTNQVIVGDKVLAPGVYEIKRLPTANNPLIFEFVSDAGKRTEVTVSAVPIVDNLARHPTSVVLQQNGNNSYVSRLWIAGETYGYEFPAPTADNLVATTATAEVAETRLSATYKPDVPAIVDPQLDIAAQQEERLRLERESQQRADLERQRQFEALQRDAERREAERAAAQRAEQERVQIAQARPPEPPPQPPPPPAASPEAGGAQQMPATADGWPMLVLSGLTLIGLSAVTRRLAR